jgi:AcrR family transcriptional regulator
VRKSVEAKQETRARLLQAAAREFGRAGFERANIDAISLDAGYSKGTIYNYFPSKEDLFVAVVEAAAEEAAARVSAPSDVDSNVRLRAALHGFCSWAQEHEAFAQVFVRECLMGTPGLYARVIQAEAPLVSRLEEILDEGRRRGDVRDDVSAQVLALAIFGLTDLALVQYWASGDGGPSLEEIPGLVLTLILGPSDE